MEECQTCDRDFVNWHAACQHMDALDHWQPQHECETCDRSFWSESACDQHMDDKGHWRHYCHDCERRFSNANCLQMVIGKIKTNPIRFLANCQSTSDPVLIRVTA